MNPHLLPKVRSEALKSSIREMEFCTLRIGTFIGKPCKPETIVPVHMDGIAPALGKGTSTKVSDINMAGGCMVCHDLLSRVDPAWQVLVDSYPAAVQRQIHFAHIQTLAWWLLRGDLVVPDGEVI